MITHTFRNDLYQPDGELAQLHGIVSLMMNFTGCSFGEIVNDLRWPAFAEKVVQNASCEISFQKKSTRAETIEFYWFITRRIAVRMEDGGIIKPMTPYMVGFNYSDDALVREATWVEYRFAGVAPCVHLGELMFHMVGHGVPVEPFHQYEQERRTAKFHQTVDRGLDRLAAAIESR